MHHCLLSVPQGINYDDKEPPSDEMRDFLSWEAMQLDESPMDPKDTETFQYRHYSMHPPFTSEHKPIVSSILKPDVWKSLHGAKTGTGFTFSNLIQSGVVGPHLPVGVILGDDECIAVFGSLIAPMAQAVHGTPPRPPNPKTSKPQSPVPDFRSQVQAIDSCRRTMAPCPKFQILIQARICRRSITLPTRLSRAWRPPQTKRLRPSSPRPLYL